MTLVFAPSFPHGSELGIQHNAGVEAQLDHIECVPQPMVTRERGQVLGREVEGCDHCAPGKGVLVRVDHIAAQRPA